MVKALSPLIAILTWFARRHVGNSILLAITAVVVHAAGILHVVDGQAARGDIRVSWCIGRAPTGSTTMIMEILSLLERKIRVAILPIELGKGTDVLAIAGDLVWI